MQKLQLRLTVASWSRRIAIALVGTIVAVVLCLAALVAGDGYRIAQYDKTVDHALNLSVDDHYTIYLFNQLDPISSKESLRIVGTRFSGRDFALALSLDPKNEVGHGTGQLVLANRRQGTVTSRDLRIPAATVRQLFKDWDKQIADYQGSRYMVLDGNPLAFDRRSGRKVQFGYGNNPCHYDRLGDLLARHLGQVAPELNEWRITPKVWSDRRHLCHPSIWGRMWHQLAIPTRP